MWNREVGPGAAEPAAEERTVICPEGSWLRVPGQPRVNLHHRGPLRRLLGALVDAWSRSPGRPVAIPALIRAGWPDESLGARTGAARVYVAIGELRSLGLRAALLRRRDGYLLDPGAGIALGQRPE